MQAFAPPQRPRLRALVMVANPSNLPGDFQPLDVPAELARARAGLSEMDLIERAGGGQATLAALEAALREDVDVLYLVAHGGWLKNLGMVVLLEKPDGRGDLVPVQKLVDGLGRLRRTGWEWAIGSCNANDGAWPGTGAARCSCGAGNARQRYLSNDGCVFAGLLPGTPTRWAD
jgi:hypothetical protein